MARDSKKIAKNSLLRKIRRGWVHEGKPYQEWHPRTKYPRPDRTAIAAECVRMSHLMGVRVPKDCNRWPIWMCVRYLERFDPKRLAGATTATIDSDDNEDANFKNHNDNEEHRNTNDNDNCCADEAQVCSSLTSYMRNDASNSALSPQRKNWSKFRGVSAVSRTERGEQSAISPSVQYICDRTNEATSANSKINFTLDKSEEDAVFKELNARSKRRSAMLTLLDEYQQIINKRNDPNCADELKEEYTEIVAQLKRDIEKLKKFHAGINGSITNS